MSFPVHIPVAKDIADSYLSSLFNDMVSVSEVMDITCTKTRADPSDRAWEFSFSALLVSSYNLLTLIRECELRLASTVKSGLFVNPTSNVFLRGVAENIVTQIFNTDPAGETKALINVLVTEDSGTHNLVFFGSKMPISKRVEWDSQTIDLIADREAGHAEFRV